MRLVDSSFHTIEWKLGEMPREVPIPRTAESYAPYRHIGQAVTAITDARQTFSSKARERNLNVRILGAEHLQIAAVA
jgi:hypothetical protein